MVIRRQPLYRPFNSPSMFSSIDREFDRLSRQLEWALRNSSPGMDRKIEQPDKTEMKDSDRPDQASDQTQAKEQISKTKPTPAPIAWRPVVELADAGKNIELRFFLPGVAAENVDIQVTQETVMVSGDRPAPEPQEGKKVWTEFRYGRFSRTIKLPEAVVNNQAQADFSNGMLTLTLPKVVETPVYKLTLGKSETADLTLAQAQPEAEVNVNQPEPAKTTEEVSEDAVPPASEAEKTWAA